MIRSLLLSIVLLVSSSAFSQQPTVIKTEKGSFKFLSLRSDIIKVTFNPTGYLKNEKISDAVYLKQSASPIKCPVLQKGKTIVVGNKVTISGTHNTSGFRGFYFNLSSEEKIFGGGERALPLNRRGYKLDLYNAPWYGYGEGADHLNYSVPFFTSSNGYALLFDNPSRGYVDIGKKDSSVWEYGAESGSLTFYIILGKDYKAILQNYYSLTGTQPLPPRWALGNLMSRFGYSSETQVKGIYSQMKAEHIPVDGVIFDLFWFGDSIKNGLGNLDWVNNTKWPNPAGMIADFKKDHVNTILVTEPFIVKNTLTYNDSRPFLATDSLGNPYQITDFYFGNAGLVDIFRKDAKDWFWKYYKKQMTMGVEGWWGDLGEPEMHPVAMYHKLNDLGYKRPFSADEVHNVYGHNWTKMLFEKYATDYPNKRLFSLNRSGFAGTQRYSIFPWTGDVSRSWGGLKAQLPVLLGMSMSGVPYVHSDAGGFAGGEGDNELYVRWLQMAVFTPIFRPHGTGLYEIDKQAFSFPSEPALIDEPFKAIAKKIVNQRYQFLAYNYSLAFQQTINKQPFMRPLYYENPTDTAAMNTGNEYYWGENMLVAPVLEKNATTRSIYLPKGLWYDYNTNEKVVGGTRFTKNVTLDVIPIYIKAGTILPLYDKDVFTNTVDLKNDSISIHYYPSNTTTNYDLYLDDGESKNSIVDRQYELKHFVAFTAPFTHNEQYHFRISSNNLDNKGRNKNVVFKFIIHQARKLNSVFINDVKQAVPIQYSNGFLSFTIKTSSERGKDYKINIR